MLVLAYGGTAIGAPLSPFKAVVELRAARKGIILSSVLGTGTTV